MKSILRAAFLGAVLMLAVSCVGGANSNSNTGQVAMSLTDDNDCGYTNVVVTIIGASVNQSATALDTDPGWVDIVPPGGAMQVDLMALQNGALQDLGLASLPPGTYNQIRLYLAQNVGAIPASNDYNYVIDGSGAHALNVPVGYVSGIRMIQTFTVTEGNTTGIIADFDVCDSLSETASGDFILRPRIATILQSVAGSITGVVSPVPGAGAVAKAEIRFPDGNFYVARQTVIRPDGSFTLYPVISSPVLSALLSSSGGKYDVVIVSSGTATSVTTGVPVVAGSATAISTTSLPTPLVYSATNETVNVTIDPTSADARVRQAVNGQTYQVRRHPVRLADGMTSFFLATDAPYYGAYPAFPVTPSVTNLSVDTPDDEGLYSDMVQTITIANGSTQDITFTQLGLVDLSAPGTVTGNITVTSAASWPVEIVLSVRDANNENVNSTGVSVPGPLTATPYVIDDLEPGTYTLDVVYANGLTYAYPAASVPITVGPGGVVSQDFQLQP